MARRNNQPHKPQSTAGAWANSLARDYYRSPTAKLVLRPAPQIHLRCKSPTIGKSLAPRFLSSEPAKHVHGKAHRAHVRHRFQRSSPALKLKPETCSAYLRLCSKYRTPFLFDVTTSKSPSPFTSATSNCVPTPLS